jgi:hypothetical protein
MQTNRPKLDSAITKAPPEGDLEEVSTETDGWQARLLKLVQEGKRIKFSNYNLPNPAETIPDYIHKELRRKKYLHLILEKDDWQQFLVPREK